MANAAIDLVNPSIVFTSKFPMNQPTYIIRHTDIGPPRAS